MKIRGVCIDLSGTLHVEDTATQDALLALHRLKSHSSLQIRFVSNTTKESRTTLLSRLRGIGFSEDLIPEQAVFTSLSATAALVKKESRNPLLLLAEDAKKEFAPFNSGLPFDSVVVGLAPNQFHYAQLSAAMNILLDARRDGRHPAIFATHKGRYFKSNDGLAMGPGPFVVALEYASGVHAQVVGKPEPAFFQLALEDMGLTPQECVQIGDDVKDDVGGALAVGMKGILVQTGKYQKEDETEHGITPTATVSNFSAAVNLILSSWV